MKCFWCWVWLLSASAGWAGLAVIRTTDGRNLAGELLLTGGRITFTPTNGAELTLDLADIAQGRFNLTNLPVAVKEPAPPADGSLPAPWVAHDIGPTGATGRATFRDGVFTLRGAGDSLWASRPDSFFFVHRPLAGDGQIVARIVSSGARNAGVMIRDVTAPESLFAMMLYETGDRIIYRNRRGERHRQQFQQEGDWHQRDFMNLPRLLKLRREGRELKGYMSWDNGEHWESFFRGQVDMGSNILAGLFVMSGDATKTAEAKFDQVAVTESPGGTGAAGAANHLVSVVLRHGTAIAGEIVSADDTTVKLRRRGKVLSLATPHVARILFQDPAATLDREMIPNRPGLVLERNDFIDGDFAGIEKGEIKLNSVLFGVRRYRLSQARALVLRELVPDTAEYEVTTLDGCVWKATTARLEAEQLALVVPVLGAMKLPWAEVSAIRRLR